ncbi:YopX family protein [Lactiplantibacillus plantarum]|uniref:YopX family protein n=1 Tax=Lactiplantibacillus plantarum TaxID=1590 RepID=UPI000975B2EF|nr:YopX family protein [Lactiplantibacillus plantarum]
MIKFRAWDNEYKVIRDYDELKGLTLDALDASDFNIEQFTGLKDVNGNDIYEGDIVQPVLSYTNSKIGKPFEVKKGNYVYGKWIAKDVSSKGFGVDGYYFSNEIQTVGNVHENPELLEADK